MHEEPIANKINKFKEQLASHSSYHQMLDLCRKTMLHGIPHIFKDDENAYYGFRKNIAEYFHVEYMDVHITGSAKLGFSPYKFTEFGLDSDIDVSIVSESLFDELMQRIKHYQIQLKRNRRIVSEDELKTYHDFLEYIAIGWIRPDKLPVSFKMHSIKREWFEFFNSISYGKSEVGNFEVNAGVFKSYSYLEEYITSGYEAQRSFINARSQ